MNADNNKKIKNKPAVLYGAAGGLISVLFLNELFQGLIYYAAGFGKVSFNFDLFYLRAVFDSSSVTDNFPAAVIALSPVLFSVFIAEICAVLLKKIPVGRLRFIAIQVALINAGYIIVKVFYGSFFILLEPEGNSDWHMLLKATGYEDTGRMMVIMMITLLSVSYMLSITARIKKYIGI